MTKLYPLTLKLTNKKVLVVGAGRVAFRKLEGLMNTGAHITVVAPEVLPEIKALPNVHVLERTFEAGDVEGMHIIYAATDSPEANDEVGSCVKDWQWFDDTAFPEASNFFTPAVVREQGLIVSIATESLDPSRSKSLKRKIAEYFKTSNILEKLEKEE